MAGSGYRTFSAGEVLTATNVNNYLMDQAVMRFADAATRGISIGTPTEGMVSYLDDVNKIEIFDGASWIDFSGDISSVTAGTALSGGGTAGDITLDVDLSAVSIPASQISDLTATATELNYTDGVTSAIQTQLNSKAALAGATFTGRVTASDSTETNASVRNITISTAVPTGGTDGDVWLQYE